MAESTNLNNINVFQSEEQYLENKNNLNASDINLIPQTNATTSEAGLMSASDKSKLDSIDSDANAYTHPSYTARSSGLYKITIDNTGHVSTTTAATKSDITDLGIPAQDTTYSAATSSVAGLMSAADKSKLDSIADGANNYTYTLPTASSTELGGVKTTSAVTDASGYTACPIVSGVPYYKDTNTTNPSFTTTVSTQAGIAPAFSKSGQTVTLKTFNTVAGIAAGTYTLSNILQKLIDSSHTHVSKNITFVDDLGSNCDCNCDCDCSGCMH